MNQVLRWSAVVIAGIGALTNLPATLTGFLFLGNWIHLHTFVGPYFQWGYLATAMACLLFSGLGLAMAARAIWRRSFCVLASVVSLTIGLAGALELPEVGPRLDMANATQRLLGHADHSLSDWDETQSSFPSDEQGLREALASRPLHEPPVFFVRGKAIPYDVRIIANAIGPDLDTVPPNPGTIVYAVSPDYEEYWLTITTLRDPVGGPVVLEHIAGLYEREPIWVMNRKHHKPGEGYMPYIE
jgi:hypothetical protein